MGKVIKLSKSSQAVNTRGGAWKENKKKEGWGNNTFGHGKGKGQLGERDLT